MSDHPTEDLNRFEVRGSVGHVRINSLPSGREVANISIGSHLASIDPITKARSERAEWHEVIAFGELATKIGESIRVGIRVYAAGYMRTRAWRDQQTGRKIYKHELIATAVEVCEHERHPSQQAAVPSTAIGNLEIHRLA